MCCNFNPKRVFASQLFIVILFLFGSASFTKAAVEPVYSESINGACVLVGNTNTAFKSKAKDTAAIHKNPLLEKGELVNVVDPGFKGDVIYSETEKVTIFNSSFAEFCVPAPEDKYDCGEMVVEKAFLNWGGRIDSSDNDLMNLRDRVYIKLNGQTEATEEVATVVPAPLKKESQYYTCHKDITDFFKGIKPGNYRFYVGNIATSLPTFKKDGDGYSSTSGWSLILVFSNKSLPKRNIIIYNSDAFQLAGTAGTPGEPMTVDFVFNKADRTKDLVSYKVDDDVNLIFTSLGALESEPNDAMYWGNRSLQTQIVDECGEMNHMHGYIKYKYTTCDVSKDVYAPGYDIHSVTYSPADEKTHHVKIPLAGTTFKMSFGPSVEHHFLNNVVLITGAPESPQAQIYVSSSSDIEPGNVYESDLSMAVGENKEGLETLKLTIPLSEYVDTLTTLSFSVPQNVRKTISDYTGVTTKVKNNSTSCLLQVYGGDGKVYYSSVFNKLLNNNPEDLKVTVPVKELHDLNTYIRSISRENENNMASFPTYLKTTKIVISLTNVTIPPTISRREVLKVGLGLRTKPANDPVYFKTTYLKQEPKITPEAELTLSTPNTGNSVFENTTPSSDYWDRYRCMDFGGGTCSFCPPCTGDDCCLNCAPDDDGVGGCNSLDGTASQDIFMKENSSQKVTVTVHATAPCRNLPDSLVFTMCEEQTYTLADINDMLITKHMFDIQAVAHQDSCIWEQAKRDSLIKYATRHGINKSRLEQLLSNHGNDLPGFVDNRMNELFQCNGYDGSIYLDSMQRILKMEIRYSDLSALLVTDKDTLHTYNDVDLFKVVPENMDKSFTISKDTTLYLYYHSPWYGSNGKGKDGACDSFIPIHFHFADIKAPMVVYNNDTLANNDTIYLCKEGRLDDILIKKTQWELNLFANTSQIYKEKRVNINDVKIYDGAADYYSWNLPNTGFFSSDTSNVTRVAIRQQSFNCKSDSLIFFVSVADMKIDQGPVIDVETTYCQAIQPKDAAKKDSITLKLEKDANPNGYEIRWYHYPTVDPPKPVLIATGDTVNVRQDTAGSFLYGASFFSDMCESEITQVRITINPMPDTIASDTISICQRYHLTSEDVFSVLRMKNSEQTLSAGNVKFYKFIDHTDSDVAGNVWTSINQDSMSLEKLLGTFDFESTCQEGGARYMNFVAQAVSEDGCPGAGALITIKVNCFEDDQPKFGYPDDQVLLCMGAKWTGDYNDFLSVEEEKKKYPKGYRWIWFDATKNDHYTYKFGNTYYKTGENSAPVIDPSFVHSDLITVVRIDSNNCISKHDTFSVVVDTSINTYPIIEDSIIPVADKRFTLTYCKGDYTQTRIPISAVGFPSADYRIEWYEKDDLNTTCKGIDSSDVVMESSVAAALENPGSTYYCVRQSTQLGCKGPWLTVQVVVYPDVTGAPQVTPAEYCQGTIPVPANVNAVNPDVSSYSLTYYRLDTSEKEGVAVKDTVAISEIKPSTKDAGVTTYYAALMDLKTKCKSPLFEIPVTVHPKPGSVVYDGDSILYYCAGIGDVNLAEEIPAKVNPDDKDTELMWLPSSTLSTDANAKVELGIYQRDAYTGCLGDTTILAVKVEKTFRYTPWPDRSYCWGDTINMCDTISKNIRLVNNYIDSTSTGYVVRRMVGETPASDTIGYERLAVLHSNAGRHDNDVQSYLITVLDSVSGCSVSDTVTFTFRGLPNIEPSKVEEYCQGFPTKLPTPNDENYTYKWLRENGTESAETVQLDKSEVFSLVEYDKFLCSDTFKVDVNVHTNPKAAPVTDLKLCQNGLELFLSEEVRPDDDHLAANLQVKYFNHVGESMGYEVNTDTIAMEGLKRVLTFTARQTDLIYGCYTDTTFKIELTKGLALQAPDMKAVCEPDTVSLSKHIKNYLNQNLSSVHLPNLSGVVIEYGRLSGAMATRLSEEAADKLTYVADHDSVKYMYRVIDAESVCSSTDTLFVVINKQPETPLVEGGADSLFFCAGNDPFKIGAENKNSASVTTAIFWNGVSDLEPTDSITVDKNIALKSYSAYTKNLKTGCVSVSDTVAVVIANAIKVAPIAKNDTLELCANEVVNVAQAAVKSFTFDLKYQSDTTVLAEVDGMTIPMQSLTAVTSTEQDTTEYIFTAKDELTQCEASNRLVLIFHQKPFVKIDAPKVVCQDTTAVLKAVDEKRPVTYAWYMDDNKAVAGTGNSLSVPSVQVPHTFKLVETLKGTLCADSTTFDLDVVTTPEAFADSAFIFCQQEGEELILFSRPEADEVYKVEWTEDKETIVSSDVKFAVGLSKDTSYVRFARQVNEGKGLTCPSEWAKADIKINKHIEVTLPDTFICSPLSFNIAEFAAKRKTESVAGYQLSVNRVTVLEGLGSPLPVDDSSKVVKAGKYQISYLDKNACESKATTNLKFIPKPLTPEVSVDSILLCQGADTFITVKPVVGEFVYHWLPVGSTSDIQADTLKITAKLPTTAAMQVWREDENHCVSDTVDFKYSVVDSITTNLIDVQHLCDGETLDLDSVGHLAFNFNDDLNYTYYPLSSTGEKGSPMIQTGAVGDEGAYLVTADNKASGCKAQKILNIDVHDNPVLLYKGKTELCENDTFHLVAFIDADMPMPNFSWTLDNNTPVNDTVLHFISVVETPHIAFEQKAELTGTYVITNTKNCVSKQVVTLLTNPAPDALLSDTAELCQNTGNVTLPVDYQQSSFNLEITANGELVDDITVNTNDVANYVFNIRQIDRTTKCKSPVAPVYVNVHPAIKLDLADEVHVCQPETYDLLNVANDSTIANNAAISEVKQLSIVSVVSDGFNIDNADKLDKSGTYVVTIADQYNCQAHDQIAINFEPKPATPVVSVDSILLCQGADTFITVKPVQGDFIYHWLPVGSTTDLKTDTLAISASLPTVVAMQVWREDAVYHCMSDTVSFKYSVVDSITTNLVDVQHICEGETVNLDSLGHLAFNFNAELDYAYYPLSDNGEKGNQMILTSAVGDEGAYLVTVDDKASGCKAQKVLSIDVHDNPVLKFKGDTILCENDTFHLVAFTEANMPKPGFTWTLDEKSMVNDSVLHFISAVETAHQALEQKAELTGTYVITNTKNCVTKQVVTLLTNPAPDALPSDTVELCQNTGNVTLPVDYQQSSFNLEITAEGEQVDDITVNTADAANYVFNIRQVDRSTKCKSQSVPVYVNVHPAISLHLPEITAICQPAVIDFVKVVDKATVESNAAVAENKQYSTVAYYFNGVEIEDASALDKSGIYRAVIEDQYHCQASDEVSVSVGLQPEMVMADTGFCQSTGDRLLAGNGSSDAYALQWLNMATAYPDSVYSDSVKVSTLEAGEYPYLMRQVDRKTGCPSEVAQITVTIYPALSVSLRDTMLCYGETFNFIEYAAAQVKGGTNPVLDSYARTVAISPLSYEAVAQKGDFYAVYTDEHACTIADTMTVDFAPEIKVVVTSNAPVCEGDTLLLKAEGADFYAWNNGNNGNNDVDNFNVVTTEDGSVQVPLKAGIRVANLSCEIDTVLSYNVKVVPELLPVADTVIEYCQGTTVDPLVLSPSLEGAKVLWYSPADDYTSVAQNGTLVPSSQTAGTFVYRFRQQLDGCSTEQQEISVEIQPAITDLPETFDTAYCLNEATVPLLAKVENPLYDVIWTNADGDTLPLGYKPSSAEAGLQTYQARLHYRACYGLPVPERVTVSLPYGEKPNVDASILFCQNTGDYTLKANSIPSGARLNWYTTIGGVRYDSIVVPTSDRVVKWTTNSFYVTQSVIDGCESEPLEVTVDIKPSSANQVMAVDTCANLPVKIANVFKRNGVTDVLDTLWRVENDVKERMDNNANIGHTATYLAATHNEWGCKAMQTVNVRMLQVEDFKYSTIKTMYCFDDMVSLSASASNANFEWYNPTTEETTYSDGYAFRLQGPQDVRLIATVLNMPVCADTVNFEFQTFPYIEPMVDGKMKVCVGSQVQLTTSNVFGAKWSVFGDTVAGDNFSFYPDQSCVVNLTGVDKNNCPVSKKVDVSTANVPTPKIVVEKSISSSFYHLNRDTFDVKLNCVLDDNYDEGLTYFWNYGDGHQGFGSMSEYYEYDSALVRLTAPIKVTVFVAHEYGCSGEASKVLLVDPDFYVPNTMAAGETFMENYELQIFDRIGNLIYQGTGWQGQKNNGDEAFADTYFYAVNYYVNGDQKVKTGYITLVR